MTSYQQKTIVITSLPTKTPTTLNISSSTERDMLHDMYGDGGGPRKRQRLTHLTPEEKMLRRKLKNRVAAQTARDRKKSLMSELEQRVAELEQENKRLSMENASLKAESGSLCQENEALKERLCAVGDAPVKTESGSGSAVSDLLPQGQTPIVSYLRNSYAAQMLTVSLTLLLASSNQSPSKLKESPQFSSVPSQEIVSPSKPHPEIAWWGPHQKNWNPSKN